MELTRTEKNRRGWLCRVTRIKKTNQSHGLYEHYYLSDVYGKGYMKFGPSVGFWLERKYYD